MPRMTCGACDMDSMPPASTIFDSPSWIICAADTMDCMPDPQRRLTVSAGTLDGHSGFKGDVARAVDGVARSLLRIADDDVIEFSPGSTPERCMASLAAMAPRSMAVKSRSFPQ